MNDCQECRRRREIMTFAERQGVQGRVQIQVIDWSRQRIVQEMVAFNKIVADGRAYLGKMIKGSVPVPTDVGVGTDNTAADDADTALGAQVFIDAITQRIDIANGVRIRFFLPSTAANGQTLREAGIFGPAPLRRMLARVTHADIAKSVSLAVNYSWDITFSQP